MPAIKVKTGHFASGKNLYGKKGLDAIIRGLAIDNAIVTVVAANVSDITDNSTGTAGTLANLVVPTASFDASTAGGADLTTFNAAIVKIEDAGKVLVNSLNNVRTKIGLPSMAAASGTEVAANTVPAQDKSVSTASGTSAVSYDSGRVTLQAAKNNLHRLRVGLNEILLALGSTPIANTLTGSLPNDASLVDIPAAVAAAASPNSAAISKAAADAFLLAYANDLATLIAAWNAAMPPSHALNVVAG